MFDVDQLIDDLIAAREDAEPRVAVKEVLTRAVADPGPITDALPPARAEIVPLHSSPTLTVLKVVWTPGMSFRPHDHGTWAAIGIYTGGEDNTFFRRADRGLVESGGKELRPGDVALLGDDTVHSVANPTAQHAGAIHVYGLDLFAQARSEWDPDTFEQRPYDSAAVFEYFEAQNQAFEQAPT
jgi:predicted metal-dependent enzyme (double-stranded beta helix superfamily)